jgi:Cft2 family RNA processing exonuclease
VLFPIDAARRVLEVALLLDKHWKRAKLHVTLVLAAPNPH